jgi:ribose 5-phosphate isomerase B
MGMKIAVGSDHGGFDLKKRLIDNLETDVDEIIDEGVFDKSSADYPDAAERVALRVAGGAVDFGILICTTGIGMSIAANKVVGIRAALVCDIERAGMARRHNDANILCLGARFIGFDIAVEAARIFISTDFDGEKTDGERHKRRVNKISLIERRNINRQEDE